MEIRLLLPKKHILKNMRKCITVPILNSCVGDSYKATCESEFKKHRKLQILEDTTDQNSWSQGNFWHDEKALRRRYDDDDLCRSEDFPNTAKRLCFDASSGMSLDPQASEVSGCSLEPAAAALGSSRGWRLHFNIIIPKRVGFTNALVGIDAVKNNCVATWKDYRKVASWRPEDTCCQPRMKMSWSASLMELISKWNPTLRSSRNLLQTE